MSPDLYALHCINFISTSCPLYVITLFYSITVTSKWASQMPSRTIVYSIVHSGADERKQQSSASLAFLRGIHRPPMNSPHKWPVTRNMFPFDDVIMQQSLLSQVTSGSKNHSVRDRRIAWHWTSNNPLLDQRRSRSSLLTYISVTRARWINIIKSPELRYRNNDW